MKILYHHRIASKDGQYVHVEEIIRSFRKLGHEVIVCEPASIGSTQFGQGSRAVDSVRALLPGFVHELAEFIYSFGDFVKLHRAIRRHKPDVIYERYNLFFPSGIWCQKLHGLPLLLEVNAPLFDERAKHSGLSLKRFARYTEDYAWRNADHVLPVTQVLADQVMQRGVNPEQVTVIHNGINPDFAALGDEWALRHDLGLGKKQVLGFTGFVRPWHRLDRVLEVIARNGEQNWHLLIVGDGPEMDNLKRKAEELGIASALTCTGIVPRQDMPKYVELFDIALQPDVVEYASPLKMFEYMFLGKAIIAPDTPNIREILADHDNALLFDSSGNDFSRKLALLCRDEVLRSKLGSRARTTIDEKAFYWDNNAMRIGRIFNKYLSATTPSAVSQRRL